MSETPETEAERIIRICGGTTATARIIGSSSPSVSKWMAPREKGGAGGKVPARHALTLLKAAVITIEDLDDLPTRTETA